MTPPESPKDFWLTGLRREGAAFRDAVSPGVLDRPVPSCPGWTVERLVAHLGGLYEWHRGHLLRGETSTPRHPRPEPPSGPVIVDWWQHAFDQMVVALDKVDPELPAWNWTTQPTKALFWHRRMAQETAVHRWDAQVSVSLPEPIDAPLAVDGIEEVLDSFLPAGRGSGPRDLHGVVRIRPTDVDRGWVVRLRGAELAVLDTDTVLDSEPDAHAAASGTASDLLLALWGRVPLSVLTIEGNPDLVAGLRTG